MAVTPSTSIARSARDLRRGDGVERLAHRRSFSSADRDASNANAPGDPLRHRVVSRCARPSSTPPRRFLRREAHVRVVRSTITCSAFTAVIASRISPTDGSSSARPRSRSPRLRCEGCRRCRALATATRPTVLGRRPAAARGARRASARARPPGCACRRSRSGRRRPPRPPARSRAALGLVVCTCTFAMEASPVTRSESPSARAGCAGRRGRARRPPRGRPCRSGTRTPRDGSTPP